jgi:hypothetical protein
MENKGAGLSKIKKGRPSPAQYFTRKSPPVVFFEKGRYLVKLNKPPHGQMRWPGEYFQKG